MTHVSRSRHVKCPYVRAIAYFERFLNELPVSANAPARSLRLRAPLRDLGVSDELALERDVAVTFEEDPAAKGLERALTVAWRPAGNGPYPSFRGSLRLTASTPTSSIVALDGDYEPPLGTIGKAFDAAVGRRIADATVDQLLAVICEHIESGYALDEPHLAR